MIFLQCLIINYHPGGLGEQGEVVQEGILWVGGGSPERGFISELSIDALGSHYNVQKVHDILRVLLDRDTGKKLYLYESVGDIQHGRHILNEDVHKKKFAHPLNLSFWTGWMELYGGVWFQVEEGPNIVSLTEFTGSDKIWVGSTLLRTEGLTWSRIWDISAYLGSFHLEWYHYTGLKKSKMVLVKVLSLSICLNNLVLLGLFENLPFLPDPFPFFLKP